MEMTVRSFRRLTGTALVLAAGAVPRVALACAACYGAPDAAQTRGMNLGIFTMLGVTGIVLASFGGMIFCFARRARRHSTELTP
jgi:heme/copper-type cytochrome/quinol oxidase subunit 2